ncbi:unnamed protein product [Prunus armeniaca]
MSMSSWAVGMHEDLVVAGIGVHEAEKLMAGRGVHHEPDRVGYLTNEVDRLKFVDFDLHYFVPFGIIGPSLLSNRFGRRADAEFVADDIRVDARHVVIGPGKNF